MKVRPNQAPSVLRTLMPSPPSVSMWPDWVEQVSVSAILFCCIAYRGNKFKAAGAGFKMSWDEKRVEHLKKLWADGYSCSQIAARMGGLTRNAVIGKVSRLGLPSRSTAFRTPAPKKRRPRSLNHPTWRWGKPKSLVPIPTEPLPPPHETDIPRVSFLDLEESQCKFICTEEPKGPFEKQFCGEPRVDGLPYCTVHSQRCYGPQPVRPMHPGFLPSGIFASTKADGRRLDAVQEFVESN